MAERLYIDDDALKNTANFTFELLDNNGWDVDKSELSAQEITEKIVDLYLEHLYHVQCEEEEAG